MKSSLGPVLFVAAITVLAPLLAAHERQVFRIGGMAYTFVVGLANEPVFVDERSGVDLRVRLADPEAPLDFSSPKVKAVEKLETSLKVEISAQGRKKVFDFEPVFRDPGLYRAHFFPTAATTYRFRVFGKVNATPFELTFTCVPGRHPPSAADKSEVKISDGVTRIFKSGANACPAERGEVAFP